ncbi:uncharacterized protein V6R79_003490 [Siganus canaliculatus]
MGSTWTSWRTTIAVFITILQIQVLISVRCKTVAGVEGQTFDFRCEYGDNEKNNSKFFCLGENNMSVNDFIRTNKHNTWERNGRYSIYDNSSGSFFIVRVDKLVLEDNRIHCCGVDVSSGSDRFSFICLNVSRANTSDKLSHHTTTESSFGINLTLDKIHLPLYLTAVMCVGALFIVCLFTLCLLLVVKHRRSNSTRLDREITSDYVTMMPNVTTDPPPDPAELSAPDLYSHLASKQRESTMSNDSQYDDIEEPENNYDYEDLNVSQIEEHIYQSINECSAPKNGNLDVKEQKS